MYLHLQQRLADHLRTLINQKYSLALDTIPIEIPPELKFGELATPIALQLARNLRKAPKLIAQEIVLPSLPTSAICPALRPLKSPAPVTSTPASTAPPPSATSLPNL